MTNIPEEKQEKCGRGKKRCKGCQIIIPSRQATCMHCKYEYGYKGRYNTKRVKFIQQKIEQTTIYNHETFDPVSSLNKILKDAHKNTNTVLFFFILFLIQIFFFILVGCR